jgi:hypothetical protein
MTTDLVRLTTGRVGAETIQWFELAVTPQRLGQLAGLITVSKANVQPPERKQEGHAVVESEINQISDRAWSSDTR